MRKGYERETCLYLFWWSLWWEKKMRVLKERWVWLTWMENKCIKRWGFAMLRGSIWSIHPSEPYHCKGSSLFLGFIWVKVQMTMQNSKSWRQKPSLCCILQECLKAHAMLLPSVAKRPKGTKPLLGALNNCWRRMKILMFIWFIDEHERERCVLGKEHEERCDDRELRLERWREEKGKEEEEKWR